MARNKLNRAAAGRLGGIATREKHGSEFFRTIGKAGGRAMHDRYAMVPVNQNDFALVDRETEKVKAVISGVGFGRFQKA